MRLEKGFFYSFNDQIPGLCPSNRLQRNGTIQGCEAAIHFDRQRQQIHVGDLTTAEYRVPVDPAGIDQTDGVRPEFVMAGCRGSSEAFCHRGRGRRIWVPR